MPDSPPDGPAPPLHPDVATDPRRGAAAAGTEGVGGSPPPPSAAGEPAPATGTRLSAAEIHMNVRLAAEEELARPTSQLVWSALGAGLTIGFSFLAAAFLASLVSEPYRHAAAAVGYPLGFIFVVIARSQLFTENTLEPVIPLLYERNLKTLLQVLRLWAIVLPVNLVGALIFAAVAAHTRAVDPHLAPMLYEVAHEATDGGFWTVAYRGVFGGWLVALMAWLVASTRMTGAQIVLIWLTTAPIAALGFSHSIAGAVEAFYFAMVGGASWGAMLGEFLVPAVLGNIVGGVTLVALLNHGQVGTVRRHWPTAPPAAPSPTTVDPWVAMR